MVCVLARLAFDFALWSDGAIPILLACEEAHRYASADQAFGLRPRAARAEADRPRGPQVRGPPLPRHAAAGRARPDDHLAMLDLLRDANDQRRRPGAAPLGGVGGGGEPPRLRALPRRPGGDRHRRGPAARRAHHLRTLPPEAIPQSESGARGEGERGAGRAARSSARRSSAGGGRRRARACASTTTRGPRPRRRTRSPRRRAARRSAFAAENPRSDGTLSLLGRACPRRTPRRPC